MTAVVASLGLLLGLNSNAVGTPSRAIENIVRAVSACAAMPQARNAVSTSAANGLSDQSPNDDTTAASTDRTQAIQVREVEVP